MSFDHSSCLLIMHGYLPVRGWFRQGRTECMESAHGRCLFINSRGQETVGRDVRASTTAAADHFTWRIISVANMLQDIMTTAGQELNVEMGFRPQPGCLLMPTSWGTPRSVKSSGFERFPLNPSYRLRHLLSVGEVELSAPSRCGLV